MSDLLLPDKIQETIKVSGITDLNLAESIASNFVPFMGEITEQTDKLKGLELGNAEHAAIAKRVNIDLGRIRSRKDEVKKKQKDYYLTVGRFIDSLANVNEGLISMGQAEAQEHSKYFERMEAERIAKLKAERNEKMSQYSDVELPNLELLSDEVFQKMLDNYKMAHEARLKAEAEAEAKRVEDERIEAERRETHMKRLEEIRPWYTYFSDFLKDSLSLTVGDLADMSEEQYQDALQKSKQAKLDHEAEQERIRLENERLKKEAEEKEKQLRKEREEALAKQREIEAKAKAEAEARAEKEQEEARLRAIEEAKKQEELDRIQKELAAEKQRQAEKEAAEKKAEEDRIAAEKALAMSGDKNRMKNWVDSFEIKSLDLKGFSPESLSTIKDVEEKFIKFKYWAKSEIEKL